MFSFDKDKRIAVLETKVNYMETILDAHSKLIHTMVDTYKQIKYGLKVDGTPRKKPGRKPMVKA